MPADTARLFPGWVPQRCAECSSRTRPKEPVVCVETVLETITRGPAEGIFVSGSCDPNPGRGGWAAVRLVGGGVLNEAFDWEPATTSSRMDLRALIEGLKLVSTGERVAVYSSSQTAVSTLKDWAPGWQRAGWRRGPKRQRVLNLDLVQEAFDVYQNRPNTRLEWLNSGAGSRWSSYARALARSYLPGAA